MQNSADDGVQKYLEDMHEFDAQKYQILQGLREIVFKLSENVNERMMYGGIMFSLNDDFGGIFAYKNHVSFEFTAGVELDDPEHILEGKGKLRRHIKIISRDEIQSKKVALFVKQAVKLASLY